jgi:hypothetical protein
VRSAFLGCFSKKFLLLLCIVSLAVKFTCKILKYLGRYKFTKFCDVEFLCVSTRVAVVKLG